MATNDFLPFATAGGANVLTPAEWMALASRLTGWTAGVAKSEELNTAWRQALTMSALVGRFIADVGGLDALDNGDIDALLDNFVATYRAQRPNYIAAVGGTANALTATLDPPITSYVGLNGTPFRLLIAAYNTGPVTLNLGPGARPLRSLRGAELNVGDLTPGAVVTVIPTGAEFRLAGPAYSEIPILVGDNTIYVRTDGSDTNDGSANDAGHALATLAEAIRRVRFLGGSGLTTIRLGNAGTYAVPGDLSRIARRLRIQGDVANQSAYLIAGSGAATRGIISPAGGSYVELYGLTVRNDAASFHLNAQVSSTLTLKNVTAIQTVGAAVSHLLCEGGTIFSLDGNIISQGSPNALIQVNSGTFNMASNIAVAGNPTVSTATCVLTGSARFVRDPGSSPVFSVTGTVTGKRYDIIENSVCNIGGGANFFPGTSAGTSGTGGIYS